LFLKRLEIKGFKSFAENTELILEPGINVIVGPNGCGKSNIADAIRWVLGEANVRHLRGQKNEDIIFNGTDKQKAQGMALVDMTIDNADGVLPVDFREVTVGRKLFRNGESEYLLNKSRVRMKDVVNLFTGTGLGKRGYSLISQGELEQVLNGQPFDRRLILEEASGTIKYRQQRDEVRQRLSGSANDLQRVTDIMGEMEIRSDELAKKATRAASYLRLWEQFSLIDKQLMAAEIRDIKKNLLVKTDDLNRKRAAAQSVQQSLEDLNARLTVAEHDGEESRQALSELKQQKYQLEAHLGESQSDIKLSQERINNLQERQETAVLDAQKYAKMRAALKVDLEKQQQNYQAEKVKWQQRNAAFQQLKAEIVTLEKAITEQTEKFEQQRRQIFEQAKQESQLKNALLSSEENLKRSREKKDRLGLRMEDNRAKIKHAEEKMQALQEQQREGRNLLQDLQKQLQVITAEYHTTFVKQEQLEAQEQARKREINNLEHKLLGLQDLERKYAGYSDGVRAILEAQAGGEKSLRGLKGLMAKIIEVPAGMERAIEVAAGKGLENIVVATAEDAREAIYYLKRKGLGRVTFLPLDGLRVQKINPRVIEELGEKEGVLGIASQLLSFDTQYEKAVEYLLGRVLLVTDMERGMQVFKHNQVPLRIVSLDGELINVSGAMTGGVPGGQKSSPLRRKAEAKKSEQQLQEQRAELDRTRLALQQLNAALKTLDDRLKTGRNRIAEVEFQIGLIQGEIDSTAASLAHDQGENRQHHQEIEAQQENIRSMEQEITQIQQQYDQLCAANSDDTQKLESMKAHLEEHRREFEIRQERSLSQQDQLDMKAREFENLASNMAQFMEVKKSYEQSVEEALKLKIRLEQDIKRQEEIQHHASQSSKAQKGQVEDLEVAIAHQQEEQHRQTEQLDELRDQRGPWLEEQNQLAEKIRVAEMRLVRLEIELEAIENRWNEKYPHQEPAGYEKSMTPGELHRSRHQTGLLKQEIEQLGPVDIESIQEYQELNARYEFLRQQSSDILEARESLEKLLQQTEKIMARNFAQFLLLANESFKRTFAEIFGGGEANLVLEADGEYLAVGVDIVIKMPGKRSQSLNLLSGGERALTCIAFIFALLRLRPTPFCLLDEIDAALDETNLIRFTEFLKGMAEDIQFIVITHRQATIEAGRNLFGVTMPQEGVSAILSLNLADSINLAG
jgi:chromosome segregation protein